MPIVIDEPYINQLIAKLNSLRDAVDTATSGQGQYVSQTLRDLVVSAGTNNFEPGRTIRDQINKTGDTLLARMTSHRTTMNSLAVGLTELLANSEYIESLNAVTAERFLEYLPGTGTSPNPTPNPTA
ncbi:hypothetical protein [Micromonospora rifamycinica]|uniref:Uncharacterized protein n=1 Tax=Micromonospora rifamycinica TaxID=291594 RepID=A0A109IKT2_9ACTN|nr:hypothetical protein [Micromonospora rifamycinica]KWV32370.1 hypothetical protein AWV63_12755 [Micromonospora rifamycinica]SCG46548.1 hypothetical protein GA0070623_1376 [Micromonospora rifamycinica]